VFPKFVTNRIQKFVSQGRDPVSGHAISREQLSSQAIGREEKKLKLRTDIRKEEVAIQTTNHENTSQNSEMSQYSSQMQVKNYAGTFKKFVGKASTTCNSSMQTNIQGLNNYLIIRPDELDPMNQVSKDTVLPFMLQDLEQKRLSHNPNGTKLKDLNTS